MTKTLNRWFATLLTLMLSSAVLAAADRDDGEWTEQARLLASDGVSLDQLGIAVALEGDTALVAANAPFTDTGAVYIFTRAGEGWAEQVRLVGSDVEELEQFGVAVGLSGDTAVVGANVHMVDGESVGAAYVFTRDGETWNESAKLLASDGAGSDNFGFSVAISGDTILVGAHRANVDGNNAQGAVYVFDRDGDTWTEQTKLTAAGAGEFGVSSALSGDTAVVGASSGAAYVLTRDGGGWSEQAELLPSDSADGRFGISVAVDGDTAVVGAPGGFPATMPGASYIYARDGTSWAEQARLTASDGEAGDRLGTSVAIDGNTVLLGANQPPAFGDGDPGAAYVFARSSGVWSETAKLAAADGMSGDNFGRWVDLSNDTALVGAFAAEVDGEENQGAAYVFTRGAAGVPELVLDPDSLATELPPDATETLTLTIANLGDAVLDWEIVEAVGTFERADGMALAQPEQALRTAVIDALGEYAYFGTNTWPGRVVKVNLETFERVDGITLDSGENSLFSAVIDATGEYAYFGTNTAPGQIVRIDLETFERAGVLELNEGEDWLNSAVIDAAGEFAYFGTSTVPGQVVKIDLETFQRVYALTLDPGENRLLSAVIDAAGEFAYFGTSTAPGRVVKIDLETFQRISAVGFDSGEYYLDGTGVIDPAGKYAYFSTLTSPGRVVRIDLDIFAHAGAITFDSGENEPYAAVIDHQGAFAYFTTWTFPGRIVKVDLDRFERVDAIALEDDENLLVSALLDPTGEYAYFGSGEFDDPVPGRVVKVGIPVVDGGPEPPKCAWPDWLAVDPQSGSLAGGDNSQIEVNIDTTGLQPGDYEAVLCLVSNDPADPIVTVPVNLTVFESPPVAEIMPQALTFERPQGETATGTLAIANIGGGELVWDIDTAGEGASATRPAPRSGGHGRMNAAAAEVTPDAHGHRPGIGEGRVSYAGAPRSGLTGEGAWTPLGPPGGDVYAVAVSTIDPELVLAGIAPNGAINGTLYRSTDGGDTWAEVQAMAGISVMDIAFTPDGTVYAATPAGVWQSVDDGEGWIALDLGLGEQHQTYSVIVDPSAPSTLWATVGDYQGAQPVNLIRSTDGGATWTDMTPPLDSPMSGRGVAVDPADSDTVVAVFGGAFGGGQVWVTTDGGDTWADRSTGLPDNPVFDVVHDGSRVLVGGGQMFNAQEFGLYQSDDLGANWTALHDASWPWRLVNAIAIDPGDPDTILVATANTGVHRSVDGGATWELGSGGSTSLAGLALAFVPNGSGTLFFGTSSQAIFRSADGGNSFDHASEGIFELGLYAIHANPVDPSELAVAFQGSNDGGVFVSADGGTTWTSASVPPTRYSAVRFAADGTLYAISSGPTTIADEGLYRREADGSWSYLGPDQGALFLSDLGVLWTDDNNPDLILLGGKDNGAVGNEATIWRSADGGATWDKVYEVGDFDRVTTIGIVDNDVAQAVIAGWNSLSGDHIGGVLRSVDGGQAWSDASVGLPGGFFREPRLCATGSSVYLSAWRSFGSGALYRSEDAGASWAATGWEADSAPRDLACHPADAGTVYLAQSSLDHPVLHSDDAGTSFGSFSGGLGDSVPMALAFAGTTHLLMAGSRGAHVTTLDAATCSNPLDLPWLEVTPDSGVTGAGDSDAVEVTVATTDLEVGDYAATLCIFTNDPGAALVTVPVSLTVTAADMPALEFEPANLDFGAVSVGTTTPAQTAMLHNTGNVPLTGLEFTLVETAFVADASACAGELAVGAACAIDVTFTPQSEGGIQAVLQVGSDQAAGAVLVLDGEGMVVDDPIFSDRFE